MGGRRHAGRDGKVPVKARMRALLTERNFLIAFTILFICMSIWVVTVPYDPIDGDKADASANAIWSEYYKEGRYAVPYDEYKADGHRPTQSVVVEKDGVDLVLNEKGPAHAMFAVVLGPATGAFFAAIGALSTYMLGRRVFGWQVGAMASVILVTNITIVIMWHRYLWVDTSTTHLVVLSMWLFVESGLAMKRYIEKAVRRDVLLAVMLGFAGGVVFGAAVGTRYTVGILIIPPIVYIFALFAGPMRRAFKRKEARDVLRTWGRMFLMFLPFFLGLLVVLVPLMNYNNTYFEGPFNSGYDATSIMEYERSGGEIAPRNQTNWVTSNPMGKVDNLFKNTLSLTPIMLMKMPALFLVPYAIWKLRRRPILYLLLPWFILIFIMFLSLDWVSMYASLPTSVVHEPRYNLPALPAIALMAGFAIDRISMHRPNPGVRRAAFSLTVVAMIALSGLVPAHTHFKLIRDGKLTEGQQPKQPKPIEPTLVTVENLYVRIDKLDKQTVEVRDCNVTRVIRDPQGTVLGLEVNDGTWPHPAGVTFDQYPRDQVPPVNEGDTVTVIGLVRWDDRDKNGKADEKEVFVSIKFGTEDKVIIQH